MADVANEAVPATEAAPEKEVKKPVAEPPAKEKEALEKKETETTNDKEEKTPINKEEKTPIDKEEKTPIDKEEKTLIDKEVETPVVNGNSDHKVTNGHAEEESEAPNEPEKRTAEEVEVTKESPVKKVKVDDPTDTPPVESTEETAA